MNKVQEIYAPTLHKLDKTHAPAMHYLEKLCFTLPWSLQQCQGAFTQQSFSAYGFLSEANLVAYLSLYHVQDEMEIVNLAVHPARQREGMGEKLLRQVMTQKERDGVQKIFLEVRLGNFAAIALYEKCGFSPGGKRKGYYPDNGEDALIYTIETPFKK